MATKPKRQGLKRAFVVTLAAGVIGGAAACGSEVDVQSDGSSDGCPSAAPAPGDACGAPRSCGYGDTYCGATFECVAGAWQSTSPPCNPPPPDLCTDVPPTGPCFTPGMTCTYDDVCEPDVVTCVGGQWVMSIGGCVNPPPPELECPLAPPLSGDPCFVFGTCSYLVETPCGPQELLAECDGLAFSLVEPTCPDPPPPGPCPGYLTPESCWADLACRWLTPGCGDPPLPAAGCFTAEDCAPGGCPDGTSCQLASADCVSCQTCDMGVQVCLP